MRRRLDARDQAQVQFQPCALSRRALPASFSADAGGRVPSAINQAWNAGQQSPSTHAALRSPIRRFNQGRSS